MTAHIDAPRPYRIFFKAPAIGTPVDSGEITVKTFVDTGLRQEDVNGLLHPETLRRLDLMRRIHQGSMLIFCIILVLAAVGMTNFFANPLIAVPAVAATLALAAFVLRARVQATRAGNSIKALQAALVSAGRLADTADVSGSTYADLQRINRSLTALQEKSGTSFDDDARTATVAVLQRDVHEPSKRQQEIAQSPATDENSNKIRAVVTASNAKWHSDVALAERLILELEDAAAVAVKESSSQTSDR